MAGINRQAKIFIDGLSATDAAATARAGAQARAGSFAAAGAFLVNGQTNDFDCSGIDELGIDITVAALTGGAGPTIQFILERRGTDGVYYVLKSTTALAAAGGTVQINVGPGRSAADAAPQYFSSAPLGMACRLRWVVTGGPTGGAAGTISAIGK